MRFSPVAFAVLTLFCAALLISVRNGRGAVSGAEAVVTLLIALSIGALAFRSRQRH